MDPSDLSGTWVLKLNVVCAVEKKKTRGKSSRMKCKAKEGKKTKKQRTEKQRKQDHLGLG